MYQSLRCGLVLSIPNCSNAKWSLFRNEPVPLGPWHACRMSCDWRSRDSQVEQSNCPKSWHKPFCQPRSSTLTSPSPKTTTPINRASSNTSYHAVDREAFHMASQQPPHSRWWTKQQSMIGIAEFGETVYFKAHGRHPVAKTDSSFTRAMWIGRDSDSSEHLIATSHGVVKSRTIIRVIPSEKWNRDFLNHSKGMESNRRRFIWSLILLHATEVQSSKHYSVRVNSISTRSWPTKFRKRTKRGKTTDSLRTSWMYPRTMTWS